MKDLLKQYAERYFYHIKEMNNYQPMDRMYFFHDGAAMIAQHAYDRLNFKLVSTGQVKTFAPGLTELKETK